MPSFYFAILLSKNALDFWQIKYEVFNALRCCEIERSKKPEDGEAEINKEKSICTIITDYLWSCFFKGAKHATDSTD